MSLQNRGTKKQEKKRRKKYGEGEDIRKEKGKIE